MKIKRMGAVFFLVVCVFCGCGKHEISHEKNGQNVSEEYRRAMEKAETTPYGAYPELVTYTLAQISGANNPIFRKEIRMRIMPIPDTFEKC